MDLQLLSCATSDARGTLQPECLLTVSCPWRGSRASGWCCWWSLCLLMTYRWIEYGNTFLIVFALWTVCLNVLFLWRSMHVGVWWLFLTISFAFLGWVAVVKDTLGIMSPGQAAEFNPLQHIRQFGEIISLHEMDGYPVWTTAAQTVGKVFTLLRQTAHWMDTRTKNGGFCMVHVFLNDWVFVLLWIASISTLAYSSVPQCHLQRVHLGQKIQ